MGLAGAETDFSAAIATREPSTRVVYFYWQWLIRHNESADYCAHVLEEAQNDSSKDRRTLLIHTRMFLDYRLASREKTISARELLHRNESAYVGFPDNNYKGAYHRASVALHRARAACLVAALPDASGEDEQKASRMLRNAERIAESGDYRLLLIDAKIVRARMHAQFAQRETRNNSAAFSSDNIEFARRLVEEAISDAETLQYAWGLHDAKEVCNELTPQ
jgi:hypothetical protein